MAFAGEQERMFLVTPMELAQEVKDRLKGIGKTKGDRLPWNKTREAVGLRPGEVSLWAGVNGHGKSEMLGQVCAWALHRRWIIASMEMPPAATVERMIRQMSGLRHPEEWLVNDLLKYTEGRLWIYDQTDTVKAESIIALAWYAAKKLGVTHMVIDSLVKCGFAPDDYGGQKEFVDRLCWLAKSTGLHIHLVHHIRKGEREENMPDKFDIKGAGEITDLVDNVFIVHRNKRKEALIEKGEDVDPTMPDAALKVAKQRHGESEPLFYLWHHADSRQFVPSPENRPMNYVREDEERAAIQELS